MPSGLQLWSKTATGITISSQGSAASGGSGAAHNNVLPTFNLNKLMRII